MKGSVRSQKLVVLDGSLFSCYSKDGRCYIACRTDITLMLRLREVRSD